MSEMKKAARGLVEVRSETFPSRHALAESQARLARALDRARLARPWPFEEAWRETDGLAELTLTFRPSAATRTFLNAASVAFVALACASAYVLVRTSDGAARFLLPLVTVFGVLGFPFVSLGMASAREARESRIRRAVRMALQDEDEAFPQQRRGADEN